MMQCVKPRPQNVSIMGFGELEVSIIEMHIALLEFFHMHRKPNLGDGEA